MAYGIGSILGDIDQKADAYRNNPDALAQSYQQNQQLIDLLVLQKLKTDKEAAQRDMQAKMQTPASTIKDQREQQVMGMTRNEVAQQVTPGLQALGQQMQAAQTQPQAQGIASVPAPNMQQVGMAGGGIIAFADGDLVRKKAKVNKADITTPQGVEDLLAQAMGTNTDVPAGYRPVNEEGRMTASPLTDVPANYRPVRPTSTVSSDPVLGTRLNNPLNIRASDKNDWEGETASSGGFEGFNSIAAGLRAADINLRNYGKKHGIDTIRGIINRWSPPSENKTEEYLSSVAKEFGASPDDKVDLNDPGIRAKLLSIMGQMETGVKNTADDVLNYIAETKSENQQEERENNARLRAQEAGGTYAERQAEHLVNTSEPFMHMYGANGPNSARPQTVLGGDSTAGKRTDMVVGHDPYGKPIYESDMARIVYGTEQQTNRAALQKPENEDRIYQQSLVSGAGSPDEDMSWWETYLANDRERREGSPTLAERAKTYLANARERRKEKPTVTEVTDSLFSGLEGFMGPEVTERMRTGINQVLPTMARLGNTSGTARERGAMTREALGSPFALAGGIGNLILEKFDPVTEFSKGLLDIQDEEPTGTGIGALVNPPAAATGTGAGTSTGSTVTPAAQDYVATLNESAPQSTLTPEQINAVLNIPANVINQAPRDVQGAYAGRLDDLESEKRSKLGFWASVLKGFAGKATLAGGLQGASDSMNERRIGIQAEINNLNKEIETIDLKRRELNIAEQANANDLTIAAAQNATNRAQIEAVRQTALNTASAKLDADNRLSNENKIAIIKMVNEKWANSDTDELVLDALNDRREVEGMNLLRLKDVYEPQYVGPFNAMREALISEDVSEMAESIVGGGGASGAGGTPTGFTYLGKE